MYQGANTQSGERLTFYKLFSQKKYRVVIPLIQRDFAQGRKTTKDVRDTFLEALYTYLNENKPNRDLDFVYGSLIDVNGETDFVPLDGQQRLTTLFLLHWYLYQISQNTEKKNEFKNVLFKDGKSLFTYETRSSSSDFCNALMSNNIDFNNLIQSRKCTSEESIIEELSDTIANSPWFYLSWKNDPTIQSMLTMLNAIHIKFKNKQEYFELLLDTENPIVTFLFLNLRDFKLTDDLYIKMNSRGKPLTPFENFKAKFEQFLENTMVKREFSLEFDSSIRDVTIKKYFSYNIDTTWANLFWNYRKLKNRSKAEIDDTFDDELMNFIRVVFSNQYAVLVNSTNKEKDNTLEYLMGTSVARKENKDYSDIITFHKYKELNVLFGKEEDEKYSKLAEESLNEVDRASIEYQQKKFKDISNACVLSLIDSFNCLANGNYKIRNYISEKYRFYFNENKIFENALKFEFESNQQRLCFHAYLRFLILNKSDRSGIDQWMRVIHNLTHPENSVIDSASDVAAALKSMEELLPNSCDILEYLKSNPNITSFSSGQVTEEVIKAHLITKNETWKDKIEEVEKHKYFNGQIGFLLEFSGIYDFYYSNKHCNWSNQEDVEYFTIFSSYSKKACLAFDESYDNRKNDKEFIFERAVLTKGDYLTTISQNRKNLLSTNLVKNNIKRDHSWKRLLRVTDDVEWTNKRLIVKHLFDDERFVIEKYTESLKSICFDKTNSWRDFFITCPSLIGYCKQGIIRFMSDDDILLYGESQSNHMHVEMHTYYLWKKHIEPRKSDFKPFKRLYYEEVKSIEDYPCIVFDEFTYNRKSYELRLYYCNDDGFPDPYEIEFIKSKGENAPDKFGEEIKEVLEQCNVVWNEDYSGYFFTSVNSDEIVGKLLQISSKMEELLSDE
jgi:hypothetical protein